MDIIQFLKDNHSIQLGKQQQTALLSSKGHILLLAVPGAGKTTVLVGRTANLILNHNALPERILNFTFSKASAQDMAARFSALFGEIIPNPPQFMTIHRLCNSILNDYAHRKGGRFTLIEGGKSKVSKLTLLRDIYRSLTHESIAEDMEEELVSAISYIKNMMIPESEISSLDYSVPYLAEIFAEYKRVKKQNAWIDFDDMLTLSLTILQKYPDILREYQSRWDFINVDEAQDNSKVQTCIIRLLADGCKNLFMVGDEDQSVYGFRGAYPQSLLEFPNTYPDAVILKMEENYRSSNEIVSHANNFISLNTARYEKNMYTTNPQGEPITVLDSDSLSEQYSKVCRMLSEDFDGTTAVIYRHNHSAIPLVDLLDRKGIGFSIREHKSVFRYSRPVGDVLAFIALSFDGNDLQALQRIGWKCSAYLKRVFLRELKPDKNYPSLFEQIIDRCTESQQLSTGRLKYVHRQIQSLQKLSPSRALDCIFHDLGYFDYLHNCLDAQTRASYIQKLNALESVAAQSKTIPQFLDRLDYLEELVRSNSSTNSKITLTTAHSAKGLEFDRVILTDLIDSVFPLIQAVNESLTHSGCELMEEEARLFYVAATRARKHLVLMRCTGNGSLPSRFIHRLTTSGKAAQTPEIGMEITHKLYGTGIITSLDFDSDRVTIGYTNGTERTYLASYLTNPDIFTLPK
ncbi:MAG: ATP-dependent helicase [Oscillospiraceae bacterium]|nr:ATP-dependent helicase [Oscillospiraceae bacterium]